MTVSVLHQVSPMGTQLRPMTSRYHIQVSVLMGSQIVPSRRSIMSLCFFFFQAEDGIRDLYVTGVQTCALPILHEEAGNLLLTGDHVLPRISPNIGLQPNAAGPPLAAYLRSLELVAAYDQAEALPAHEYRFHGLADRVRMLLAHHERRCEEVIAILARRGPATVWEVTQDLSWSRGWASVTGFMRRAAIAEAAAHLRHLADEGRIGAPDAAADGP